MTGPGRVRPGLVIAAIAVVAVLAVALVMAGGDRNDADGPRISVVPGAGSPTVDPAAGALPSNGMAAVTEADPSPRIVQALTEEFPALSDIESRCDGQQCSVRAMASEPPGGEALTAYEDMVRTGLAAALNRAGMRMTGPVQIEEAGGDRYRLLIRATPA